MPITSDPTIDPMTALHMQLREAREKAERLVEAMRPHCERVEIAGSILREKPEVGDIEIVCVPKWETGIVSTDLFGTPELLNCALVWAYDAEARGDVKWIKSGTSEIIPWEPKRDGKYWRGLLPCGIKLDLFLACRENYGVIKMIRTGSSDFSKAMVTRALKINKRIQGGFMHTPNGDVIETPEETDVFEKLGVQYIPPRQRNSEADVKIIGFKVNV